MTDGLEEKLFQAVVFFNSGIVVYPDDTEKRGRNISGQVDLTFYNKYDDN